MQIKKIYITGGSGLVGRNIRENTGLSGCKIFAPSHSELELMNYEEVCSYIKIIKPDLIIHTAGKVGGIVANMQDPYGFFLENILMGINLVRAAREVGVPYFLNLSSSCFYPTTVQNPLKEDTILTGSFEKTNEGYALAKVSVLKMCEYISNQFDGYYYKTLIPCNLYGRYDNFSLKNSHLIPAIIRKILEAKEKKIGMVEIWGDGESRREFMYAGHFSDIVVKVIDKFELLPNVINIGVGSDLSINSYYALISEVLEYNVQFTHDLSKPNGMKQKLLDISKQKELGLYLECDLKYGISRTCDYYLNEYDGD